MADFEAEERDELEGAEEEANGEHISEDGSEVTRQYTEDPVRRGVHRRPYCGLDGTRVCQILGLVHRSALFCTNTRNCASFCGST